MADVLRSVRKIGHVVCLALLPLMDRWWRATKDMDVMVKNATVARGPAIAWNTLDTVKVKRIVGVGGMKGHTAKMLELRQ